MKEPLKLTHFSHGAGCGCKISPKVLDSILRGNESVPSGPVLVANDARDDAAVYDLGNGTALLATTDFFMPVVDDPLDFGRVAAANALSDIYAMGGRPLMALSLLGWPVDKIPPEIASRVVEGALQICLEAGISIAGGHSIDSQEPIFGLSVNGLADLNHIKRNNSARVGNLLFLTKPLGTGILTTAAKKGWISPEDLDTVTRQMSRLNRVGEALGRMEAVRAMTDVTGFGLLGHLKEMAEGSSCSALLHFGSIPLIQVNLEAYIGQGAIPGGTNRNWESYGQRVSTLSPFQKTILADPQTSGGLLIALDPAGLPEFERILEMYGLADFRSPIGEMVHGEDPLIRVD